MSERITITKSAAGRILGVCEPAVRRLIAQGKLSVLEVPSSHPKLFMDEVEALRDRSVRQRTEDVLRAG